MKVDELMSKVEPRPQLSECQTSGISLAVYVLSSRLERHLLPSSMAPLSADFSGVTLATRTHVFVAGQSTQQVTLKLLAALVTAGFLISSTVCVVHLMVM